ncbi:MAG: hypothetical protein QM689_05245 [Oscillospiraceae bacterium]
MKNLKWKATAFTAAVPAVSAILALAVTRHPKKTKSKKSYTTRFSGNYKKIHAAARAVTEQLAKKQVSKQVDAVRAAHEEEKASAITIEEAELIKL